MRHMDVKKIIADLGGAQKVAALVGVSFQAVYQWKKVPAEHVLKISKALGVSPKKIRPDVFDPEVAA